MYDLLLDIGGTKLKYGLFHKNKLFNVEEIDSRAREGKDVLLDVVYNVIKDNISLNTIEKIGISTAGQVDFEKGTIIYANENIPNYTGCKLKTIIEDTFQVKVLVENDVNSAAVGEYGYGIAREYNNFAMLTYGTGVGGAIIIDGKLYRGSCFTAGEFGGIWNGNNYYEKTASTTALVNRCMKLDPTYKDGRIIFEHIEDERVKQVIDLWTNDIAFGIVNIIHIMGLEAVILGGGIMEQKKLVSIISSKVKDKLLPSFKNVKINSASLGNKAGLYGMAYLLETK